ncbi:hypothetical protein ACSYAD_13725 [Acaryochloris marina NIES-2412]
MDFFSSSQFDGESDTDKSYRQKETAKHLHTLNQMMLFWTL